MIVRAGDLITSLALFWVSAMLTAQWYNVLKVYFFRLKSLFSLFCCSLLPNLTDYQQSVYPPDSKQIINRSTTIKRQSISIFTAYHLQITNILSLFLQFLSVRFISCLDVFQVWLSTQLVLSQTIERQISEALLLANFLELIELDGK